MQLSNGLSNPFGLWIGHAMFDSILVVAVSTVVAIVFSQIAHNHIAGPGFLVGYLLFLRL